MRARLLTLALLASTLQPMTAQKPASTLHWNAWSDSVFAQAKREHKFVLLDLEAVWCHWCHVMDTTTYRDPHVTSELNAHYLLVRVDQDARPDISNRYQDYGWPATVVFAPDGGEIVKRQGYIDPTQMMAMLNAILADPSPGPSIEKEKSVTWATSSTFSPSLLADVRKAYESQYDADAAGWAFGHKYLDALNTEYGLRLAQRGDRIYVKRVRDTLDAAAKLIDPVWGGADQYSTGGVWTEPHFEKLLSIQAAYIRTYALAYGVWPEPKYASRAQAVHFYVHTFLTDPATGAFYVSQDADIVDGQAPEPYYKLDDAHRRSQGIPRIDKHLYARENGWMIAALAQLYANTGDATALSEALRAAHWVESNRALPGGGFRHDAHDAAGPYLSDTLSMGQAALLLFNVTGDRHWIETAEGALRFINANFRPQSAATAGYVTSKSRTDRLYPQHADRDENIALARWANFVHEVDASPSAASVRDRALRYVATPEIATAWLSGGVLLTADETTHAAVHVTVIGRGDDPATWPLQQAALRPANGYIRTEFLPSATTRGGVTYPTLPHAAAFLCTATACSSPIATPEALRAKLAVALAKTP